MSFAHEWNKFTKNPIGYTSDRIQEGLGWLNEQGKKVGLVSDPHSDKETYTPIARYNGSEYLEPTAMRNEDYYHNTVENIPTGYTGDAGYNQIVASGKGVPNEINTAKIDNFVPNTAKGGNNMEGEQQTFWDKYGKDIMSVASIGANLYNQSEQNKFNAEEAKKNREFEERMSNTAFQRQASDMALAGVNPVASADMGGASTPSGSQATGTTPYYADPLTIANTALTQAQISNVKADTNLKGKQSGLTENQTKGIEIDNEWKNTKYQVETTLQKAQTKREKALAEMLNKQVEKADKEIAKMDEEIAILKNEGKIKEAEMKTITRNRRFREILDRTEQTLRIINSAEDIILKPAEGVNSAMQGLTF